MEFKRIKVVYHRLVENFESRISYVWILNDQRMWKSLEIGLLPTKLSVWEVRRRIDVFLCTVYSIGWSRLWVGLRLPRFLNICAGFQSLTATADETPANRTIAEDTRTRSLDSKIIQMSLSVKTCKYIPQGNNHWFIYIILYLLSILPP